MEWIFLPATRLFKEVLNEVLQTSRPVLIEAVTERFRGHSISDPGLYRSKEELQKAMERDPILLLKRRFDRKQDIERKRI